ncbi:sigma-54-dependent transcriptional regulator [Nannocystis pusilla]|uniref:sigma-54-dependent transcriptional regulator n=1 Tax=Nannocystis pusilla TaxID=889268 RepID=UPI001CCC65BA|nr:sigma 54-interacting transcriptional regulator [Nannocystis pusilla]
MTGSSIRGPGAPPAGPEPTVPALMLIWSHDEPERVGEVFCLPRGAVDVPFTIGRAVEPGEDGALPLVLQQLRPFSKVDTGPLRDARVSRWHMRVRALADGGLLVERLGRGELRVNGHEVERAIADPGDVVEAAGRFALLLSRRPSAWPRGEPWGPPFPFGAADACGIVGESPAAWELRRQVAAVTGLGGPVLVHGPTGAGKELVVRALHAGSPRAGAPLVARHAATIPEPLIDAELFGNLRDYPSPGIPDRAGLLGEAHGGALFLDELGELPHALQGRLLRVLDCGEYQRLGEPQRRVSDARIFGATNRDLAELKHDLVARFVHRLRVPGLDERRDDVALLVPHVLGGFAGAHPELRARLFAGDRPRTSAALLAALVQRSYSAHVRELVELLWRAVTTSTGGVVETLPDLAVTRPPPRLPEPHVAPGELTREEIVAALAACDGVREQAWRALKLRSRDQLKRLMKKYDIS